MPTPVQSEELEASPIAPRRRNGRPQACEPCRKRKIACDHTQPICQRCRVRKVASRCIYLDSPMTQQNVEPEVSTEDAFRSVPVVNVTRQHILNYRRDPGRISKSASRSNPLFSGPAAFLGPTSFSSVFLEHRSRLEPTNESPATGSSIAIGSNGLNVLANTSTIQENLPSDDLIHLGVDVLKRIPEEKTCKKLLSMPLSANDGWPPLASTIILESLWATHGRALSRKNVAELTRLSMSICQNGIRDLEEADESRQWVESFTNENLRWEALGILFMQFSFALARTTSDNPVFETQAGHRKDQQQFILEMKECALSCIALCSQNDCGNTLVVYLLYKHSLLESITSGDASQIFWRQHADVMSVITSLGYHRDSETSSPFSSVRTEMKRRIFAAAFNIDKVISTYTGRPPMLSHRYSSTPLPLDLSDEDFLGDDATRTRAVSLLDPVGWNTKGEVYPTTILRSRILFAYIRDEVLEMALGTFTGDVAIRAIGLKDRSVLTYDRLPSAIKLDSQDMSNTQVPGTTLYAKFVIRLEHLHNMFLLERLIMKHARVNGQELLNVAREMLDLVIHLWVQRERFLGMQCDYQWLIMYYAAPACGTLCVELLKQAKGRTEDSPSIPRSSVIQNLGMLIAFLDWIKASAQNEDLCSRVRNIISRVLDQILDPLASSDESMLGVGDLPFYFPEIEDFGRGDLLDTFDWMTS